MRFPLYYLAPVVLLAAACSGGPASESTAMDSAIVAADSTAFSHDITAINSPSRKRVRTADLRCRVTNVFEAVSVLEHVVSTTGGMIAESTLQNEAVLTRDLPYCSDSLKRVQLYTPTANLTLRVPVTNLDSVVRTLTSMATFIDYRILKEEDKTLAYLANALKNNAPTPAALKPASKGTTLDVATYQDHKQAVSTDRRIENLAILDDVHYATFSVQIFQPQQVDIQVIANPETITRAGFGTRTVAALSTGAENFRGLLLFLIECWPLLLLTASGLFIYRKMTRKKLRAL
jgi:hypothetical protein